MRTQARPILKTDWESAYFIPRYVYLEHSAKQNDKVSKKHKW